jgi:uncharacterized membrane protein YvlD (DUF360 family)
MSVQNNPYQPVMPPQPYQRDSSTAIVSLVFGILAYFILPILGALVAVICGHVAMSEINNSNGLVKGKGLATAGLIMGYVQLGLFVVVIAALLLLAPTMGSVFSDINSSMYY